MVGIYDPQQNRVISRISKRGKELLQPFTDNRSIREQNTENNYRKYMIKYGASFDARYQNFLRYIISTRNESDIECPANDCETTLRILHTQSRFMFRLPIEVQLSIKLYTSHAHYIINYELNSRTTITPQLASHIENIKFAIHSIPVIQQSIKVYAIIRHDGYKNNRGFIGASISKSWILNYRIRYPSEHVESIACITINPDT